MKKLSFLGVASITEVLIISAIAMACALPGLWFYFFYNLIYGLLLSMLLPLWMVYRKKETLSSLGISPLTIKQGIVIVVFVVFSVGGQAIPLLINGTQLEWSRLLIGVFPLVMTTFFEELLFRGFMQTRFEKQYGVVPAIVLSGLFFSLYHLGYPGFRNVSDLALLFAVGTGFALAYKLSGNNLAAAYFVNLPNALLTYLLKYEQFPVFDTTSVIFAVISIAGIGGVMVLWGKRLSALHPRSKSV